MAETASLSPGDWIVHYYYGVGQVKSIEEKFLDGREVTYYKVKTRNSLYFIPIDEADNSRLRPLATRSEIKEVVRILKKEPREMDADHNKRKRRIKKVMAEGSLKSIARLVRDLAGRQAMRKLNPTEEDALQRFTDRLVREWAVCLGTDAEKARAKFSKALEEGLEKVR